MDDDSDACSRVDAAAAGSTRLRQDLAAPERETFDRWFVVVLSMYVLATAGTALMAVLGVRDAIGYLASFLVLGSFASQSMVPLRVLAAFSNLAFIVYAIECDLPPVLLLHMALLPVNLFRIAQLNGWSDAVARLLANRRAGRPDRDRAKIQEA
jgi:hypothetical protein